MTKYSLPYCILPVLLALLLFISGCKKVPHKITPELPPPAHDWYSYLKVGTVYYKLTESTVLRGAQNNKTRMTIWFTNPDENNGVMIDFLILTSTSGIPEGRYEYKKVNSPLNMEENSFHSILLQFGSSNQKKQISSFNINFTRSFLIVKKVDNKYILEAEFEYQGTTAKVYYEGDIEFL